MSQRQQLKQQPHRDDIVVSCCILNSLSFDLPFDFFLVLSFASVLLSLFSPVRCVCTLFCYLIPSCSIIFLRVYASLHLRFAHNSKKTGFCSGLCIMYMRDIDIYKTLSEKYTGTLESAHERKCERARSLRFVPMCGNLFRLGMVLIKYMHTHTHAQYRTTDRLIQFLTLYLVTSIFDS